MTVTQQAKQMAVKEGGEEGYQIERMNTAFVDGVRRFAMDVRELDILGGHPKPATRGHLKTGHHDG